MNKLFIIGNLTRDPETRTTTSGVSVCSFSVAVSRRYSSSGGERQTDFFRVSAWRQLGETCQKYLAKGRKVAVVGELQPRLYEASDGTTRLSLEVNADEVEFLTPKSHQEDAPTYTAGSPKAAFEEFGFENVNDELPF